MRSRVRIGMRMIKRNGKKMPGNFWKRLGMAHKLLNIARFVCKGL